MQLPEHTELADSSFGKPAKIYILIRAEHFYEILETDKHKISQLIFQKTVFNYIVSITLKVNAIRNFVE